PYPHPRYQKRGAADEERRGIAHGDAQHDAERAAEHANDNGFEQELLAYLPGSGPEGLADTDFAGFGRPSRSFRPRTILPGPGGRGARRASRRWPGLAGSGCPGRWGWRSSRRR
nr:hypothetical protein [Tanacetum cinerariifolium]